MSRPFIVLAATFVVAIGVGLYFGPLGSSAPKTVGERLYPIVDTLALESIAPAATAHARARAVRDDTPRPPIIAPRQVSHLLDIAEEHIAAGDPARAVVALDGVLVAQPSNVDVLHRRGIALVEAGRPQEAIKDFSQVIAEQPSSPDVHLWLAKAYEMKGRPDWALASFNSVLSLTPDHAEALAHRDRLVEVLATLGPDPATLRAGRITPSSGHITVEGEVACVATSADERTSGPDLDFLISWLVECAHPESRSLLSFHYEFDAPVIR